MEHETTGGGTATEEQAVDKITTEGQTTEPPAAGNQADGHGGDEPTGETITESER